MNSEITLIDVALSLRSNLPNASKRDCSSGVSFDSGENSWGRVSSAGNGLGSRVCELELAESNKNKQVQVATGLSSERRYMTNL